MINRQATPTFVDLFAGCGGLSLGLVQAGWKGVFAVEVAQDAFSTFCENFLYGPTNIRFEWPDWLEVRAQGIDDILTNHRSDLAAIKGTIDVIAGGPPCQGYSFAGRRRSSDPRNKLFERYVELVSIVKPTALILENVPGMQVAHGSGGKRRRSFYDKLVEGLQSAGYRSAGRILEASKFGVPQRRPRLIVVGLERSLADALPRGIDSVFDAIEQSRTEQLTELCLGEKVSAFEAISDLCVGTRPLRPVADSPYRGRFFAPTYNGPLTPFQVLMNEGFKGEAMDSIRLANHRKDVIRRFAMILRRCRRGTNLSDKDREKLGLLKHRTVPMDPDKPSPTLTTLPDDLLHYGEPRILTVREYARLQSFPDWFKFRGVYTTGGKRRRKASPRYTQVGNAVPPLLARGIALGMARILDYLGRREGSAVIAEQQKKAA